jgi:hypothetical protein
MGSGVLSKGLRMRGVPFGNEGNALIGVRGVDRGVERDTDQNRYVMVSIDRRGPEIGQLGYGCSSSLLVSCRRMSYHAGVLGKKDTHYTKSLLLYNTPFPRRSNT